MTTTVRLPGNYWGDITLGVLDDRARRCFTMGQCHAFAIALNRATGWPILLFDGWGGHVVVQHPSGRVVDIEGFKEPEDVANFYGDTVEEHTEDSLREALDGSWYALRVEEAETFVAPLLESIQQHREA